MEYRAQVPYAERRLPDENDSPAKKFAQYGIVNACVGIPFFQDLSTKDKNDLVNSMYISEFQPGEVIVQQGTAGCNMYIVVDGNPLVIEKAAVTNSHISRTSRDHLPIGTQSNSDITLLRQRLSPGDTFGEECLIHSCPHSASVIVPNERPSDRAVTLWALSKSAFHSLLTVNALNRRKILSDVLSEVHIFSQLCNYTRIQVEKSFVIKEFKEGDTIIGEKVEARFHVIVTGEATRMTKPASRHMLTAGMYVGEDTLSAHSGPSMDCQADASEIVVARTAVETWSINQRCFKRLLNSLLLKKVDDGSVIKHSDDAPSLIPHYPMQGKRIGNRTSLRKSCSDPDMFTTFHKARNLRDNLLRHPEMSSRKSEIPRMPTISTSGHFSPVTPRMPAIPMLGRSTPGTPRMPAIPMSTYSSIVEHSTALTEQNDRTDVKDSNICIPPLSNRTGDTDQTDEMDMDFKIARNLHFTGSPRGKNIRLRNVTHPSEPFGSNSKSSGTKNFKQRPPQMKTMDAQDLVYLKELGHGLTGQVFLCQLPVHQGNGYGAVKVMRKKRLIKENQVQNVIRENKLLSAISNKCPFIVSRLGQCADEYTLYLIMEWVNGGDLFQNLVRNERFTIERARLYAAQVLLALEYIHSCGYIFRDLKPENIMLSLDGHVKLIDFGFCKALGDGEKTFTVCGTPAYMSPEMLCRVGHDRAADLWALGVLIFEMLAGHAPFDAPSEKESMRNIVNGAITFPGDFDSQAKDLIENLCKVVPEDRLGMKEVGYEAIKARDFFAGTNWHDVANCVVKMPPVTEKVNPRLLRPIHQKWVKQTPKTAEVWQLSPEEQSLFEDF